ncbi:zf-HC2 domain-containing protein [Oscillibacter sp.]|uniref:zf-HC2 domain-containing protein n=1 Tax=Oscillibacter sp. TaxID=1945593 RepID=UPI002628D56A|nr:zf-HC2 domain-containing protein [Oscillibacter sp.]MDD3347177.1 zf-HC2 domain-containing protein [Oscillibacter sp.]
MKLPCRVIEDLLPLYHDHVCSPESRAMVEEHLRECGACAKILAEMEEPAESAAINDTAPLKAIGSAWKKSKKQSFLKGTLIAVLVCADLFGAYYGITQWKCIPVSADVLEVTELSQLSDGSIYFNLFVNDNKNLYFSKFTTTEDGSFYITPMHSLFETTRKYDVGGFDQFYVFSQPGGENEDSKYPVIFLSENVTQIYVGPVGEGALVWEEGMELPPASEAYERQLMRGSSAG